MSYEVGKAKLAVEIVGQKQDNESFYSFSKEAWCEFLTNVRQEKVQINCQYWTMNNDFLEISDKQRLLGYVHIHIMFK